MRPNLDKNDLKLVKVDRSIGTMFFFVKYMGQKRFHYQLAYADIYYIYIITIICPYLDKNSSYLTQSFLIIWINLYFLWNSSYRDSTEQNRITCERRRAGGIYCFEITRGSDVIMAAAMFGAFKKSENLLSDDLREFSLRRLVYMHMYTCINIFSWARRRRRWLWWLMTVLIRTNV